MSQGPTKQINDFISEYRKAAKDRKIYEMIQMDKDPLIDYIPPEERCQAITSILTSAPFVVLIEYLYCPVHGITPQMQKNFIEYAQSNHLIDPPRVYTPSCQAQQARGADAAHNQKNTSRVKKGL